MPQHPPPCWLPYADAILERLSWTIALKDDGPRYGRDDVRSAPDAEPPIDVAGEVGPKLGLGASTGRMVDSESTPQPSPQQISLALRLAASFGSRDAFSRCMEPGAVTVLGGMTPGEIGVLSDLLRLAFLPPLCQVCTKPGQIPYADSVRPKLLRLAPEADDDEISRYALRKFHDHVSRSPGAAAPVLILLPDEALPPKELARYLPPPIPLVPVGREIIMRHLQVAYDDFDQAVVSDAMPTDQALAGLTTIALNVALRAPDALEAARRLGEFLPPDPRSGDGPRLEDIAGDGEALAAARQLVADLLLWQQNKLRWSDLCRSLLLYGRPGTGKTFLARAMGRSAGISFVAASFAGWQATGHLGDMLRSMRASFAEARRQSPAILFIDEIDAVGSREDSDRHASNYRHQVIAGFLELMDGIAREEGVIVVGACNFPDRIDPAVLRPGRFDLKIEVPLPDTAAIFGILRHRLGDGFDEGDLRDLARSATGSSAAEVDGAIRKARADARGAGRAFRLEDLQAQFAPSDPRAADWDRRAAIHECGHAIVCRLLDCGEVSRVLLADGGGMTGRLRRAQNGLPSDLEAELTYHMAGRAAERLICGNVSAGSGGPAHSDLAQATKLAVAIDTLLGLGGYGPVWMDTPPEVVLRDPKIRARIRHRLETAEARAGEILAAYRGHLEAMAAALARERMLTGDALSEWLAPLKQDGGLSVEIRRLDRAADLENRPVPQ